MDMKTVRLPNKTEIVLIIILFLAIMYVSLAVFELPIQLALLAAWVVVGLLGLRLGHTYDAIQGSIVKGINQGVEALLVIIFVGALIGGWIAGGVVPTLIYYGLDILHPSIFLFATLIICALTAIATGTSWGTVGTVGIAMMGIGQSFGVPMPLVAGAIISGAYFGDKLSPLSDSTVMAASLAKVEIITHVRSMLYISVPALVISSVLYLGAGFLFLDKTGEADIGIVATNMAAIQENFQIGWYMLIPIVLVLVLLANRFPAIPTIAIGALLGMIWAYLFQGMDLVSATTVLYEGYMIESGTPFIDTLFNRGGIVSMLGVIVVMILALGFGGLMEQIGILEVMRASFSNWINNTGRLTVATIVSAFLGNFFGSAGYVSLITGTKVTEKNYDEMGIDRKVLSRNTESGGILTAPMVPWSDNGIYMATVLGVSTMSYLPFLWLNFVGIGIAIFYGYTGRFMWKAEGAGEEIEREEEELVYESH